MAKAHVDPEELRRFARDLTRFNAEISTLVTALQSRLRSLEQTWQDQEQHKFSEEFGQAMKTLTRFLALSDEHVAFLSKKAGFIEEYLRQR
jgi:WXG100 family type VII secretion target